MENITMIGRNNSTATGNARLNAAAMVKARLAGYGRVSASNVIAPSNVLPELAALAHASVETPFIDDYAPLRPTATDGYIALGYRGGLNVIWSSQRSSIEFVDANTVNCTWAEVFCGRDWLKRKYFEAGSDGVGGKFNVARLRSDLISACQYAGRYNAADSVGAGVFKTPEGRIVVNSGSDLWSPDGRKVSRVSASGVYMEGRRLGFDAATSPATDAEVLELKQTFDTWRWSHTADPVLTLGWAVTAPFCGMLRRRPILLVTGVGGSGKSSLLDLIRGLYDKGRLSFSGTKSTAAGIEQQMERDVLPTIIDEYGDNYGDSQRENQRIEALQAQARGAYGEASDGNAKGTSDGRGVIYSNRHSTLFAGIYTPPMLTQDRQRTIQVRINKIAKAIGNAGLPELCCTPSRIVKLGASISARMLRDWAAVEQSLDTLFSVVLRKGLGDGRTGDTLALPLAGWFVLVHGRAITAVEAEKLLDDLHIKDKVAMLESSNDERNCADWICGFEIQGESGSVGDALRLAYEGKDYSKASLERLGLKIDGTSLQVCAVKSLAGIRTLFDKSPFADGRHAIALERAPDARFCEPRFGGKSTKAVAVPLAWVLEEGSYAPRLAQLKLIA